MSIAETSTAAEVIPLPTPAGHPAGTAGGAACDCGLCDGALVVTPAVDRHGAAVEPGDRVVWRSEQTAIAGVYRGVDGRGKAVVDAGVDPGEPALDFPVAEQVADARRGVREGMAVAIAALGGNPASRTVHAHLGLLERTGTSRFSATSA